MLRLLLVALLLANGLYFAGAQGYLSAWGWPGPEPREPERLQAQIRPEVMRLLPNPAPPSAPTPSPAPAEPPSPASPEPPAAASALTTEAASSAAQPEATTCWQAEGWSPRQANALRRAIAPLTLPEGSWQLDDVRSNGQWLLYMGRYSNEAQLARKKDELRALNVVFSDTALPGMSPGLVLSSHATEAAAQQALQALVGLGVRTARVLQDRSGSTTLTLRLPAVSVAQRDAVAQAVAPLADKAWQPCP